MPLTITYLDHSGFLFDDGQHTLATHAAQWVKPKTVMPIHYKTFPLLTDGISEFKPKGVEVKEMQPGENWTCG